jgi:hypothetical protein
MGPMSARRRQDSGEGLAVALRAKAERRRGSAGGEAPGSGARASFSASAPRVFLLDVSDGGAHMRP